MSMTLRGAILLFAIGGQLSSVSSRAEASGLYTGVLSDAHAHAIENVDPQYVIDALNRANVDMIVIMRKEDDVSDEDILKYHQQHPSRIVPVIGLQTLGWREHRQIFVRKVRAKVASREYQWMGEATVRGQVNGKLIAPPDSPLLQELLETSAQHRFPLTIHHNAFDSQEVQAFLETLAKHPRAIVVWAHWCGLSDPAVLRPWLDRLPNLHCDLGWLHQDQSAFPNPLVDRDGQFLPAWKQLIETYADRFLAAINASEVDDFRRDYQNRAAKVRKAVGGLEPAAARKVATENFHRLLGR